MVEKTGHKTTVLNRRREWIAEERRKELGATIEEDENRGAADDSRATDAPQGMEEQNSGPVGAPGEDDDIYTASPRRPSQPANPVDDGQPDDDDLEALMMEADNDIHQAKNTTREPEPDVDAFADEEAAMAEMGGFW